MAITVPIPGPLRPARFVDRPNRFIVRANIEPEGDLITAHLPDPGRLKELLVEGTQIFVRSAEMGSGRKTAWTAALVSAPSGALVSLDTTLPNHLIRVALEQEAVDELAGWALDRPEVPIGRSRFDFLLQNATGEQLVLEVKSVTMVQRNVGLFPDAPTERGTRHLQKLIEITERPGWHAAVLFVAQRIDAEEITAAAGIDPVFARTLDEARASGVRIFGRRCQVTLQELVLGIPVPVV